MHYWPLGQPFRLGQSTAVICHNRVALNVQSLVTVREDVAMTMSPDLRKVAEYVDDHLWVQAAVAISISLISVALLSAVLWGLL